MIVELSHVRAVQLDKRPFMRSSVYQCLQELAFLQVAAVPQRSDGVTTNFERVNGDV